MRLNARRRRPKRTTNTNAVGSFSGRFCCGLPATEEPPKFFSTYRNMMSPAAAARTNCADAGAVKTAAPNTTDSLKPEGKNVWAGVREGRALSKPHNLLVYLIEFPHVIFHSPGRIHNFSFFESQSFLIFGLSLETVADDHRGRPGIVCGVTGHKYLFDEHTKFSEPAEVFELQPMLWDTVNVLPILHHRCRQDICTTRSHQEFWRIIQNGPRKKIQDSTRQFEKTGAWACVWCNLSMYCAWCVFARPLFTYIQHHST